MKVDTCCVIFILTLRLAMPDRSALAEPVFFNKERIFFYAFRPLYYLSTYNKIIYLRWKKIKENQW